MQALRRSLPLLLTGLLLSGCNESQENRHRVVVLGIDGMDHGLSQRLMAEGRLPNLAALSEEGGFRALGTSIPPESPVAWSNFITGQNPGGHGIYDFLQPNWIETEGGDAMFVGEDSIYHGTEDSWILRGFGYKLPLKPGDSMNKRRGATFWEVLEDHGIPATVFKIPANYPPTPTEQKVLSGMGTPDVSGGYGTYYIYTDDQFALPEEVEAKNVVAVTIYDNVIQTFLKGPENPLIDVQKGDPPAITKVPLRIDIDPTEPLVRIRVGGDDGEQVILREGEWSEFTEANFDIVPYVTGVTGIVRFYLQEVRPTFRLFVDPINASPLAPAFDMSTPPEWVTELAEKYGLFMTKGMPENTEALKQGVISHEEMRAHSLLIYESRKKLLFDLLDDHQSGLLFDYFSSIDLNSHMFWACMDDQHPGHVKDTTQAARDFIEWLYEDMDRVIGEVRRRMAPEDTLIVMSDHGFSPYYRAFNLNTWLLENGYLTLKEDADRDADPGFLSLVDWSKTRAYNFGFCGLYLNLKGRDPMGIVEPSQADALVDEICSRLIKVVDPENGEPVFLRMYKSREVYSGEAVELAPEIVVGFQREYRNSDKSSIGEVPKELIGDNLKAWSGCHLMAAEAVPGVLFSNRDIRVEDPKLYDLTATILSEYGIEKPDNMVGRPLWPARTQDN